MEIPEMKAGQGPAVKGRMSLEAIATDPPRTRDTIQPVRAPTAVSSCSMIACKCVEFNFHHFGSCSL